MKKLLLALAVITSCAISPSFANITYDDILIYVDNSEGKAFNLQLANLQKVSTKVAIKDMDGSIYFEDYITDHNGYAKKINLKKLKDGKYLLNVMQGKQKLVQVIVVKGDKLWFSKVKEG